MYTIMGPTELQGLNSESYKLEITHFTFCDIYNAHDDCLSANVLKSEETEIG